MIYIKEDKSYTRMIICPRTWSMNEWKMCQNTIGMPARVFLACQLKGSDWKD